jgi:glycosyltransferase involved in cell wall biosynthesis
MVAFVSDPASASGSASARLTDAASDGADPILSVIMPVHEGAEWIAATLDSLAAEPTDGLEIIVIDSSPTSQTSEIVSGFADCVPLKLLHRPDLTPWQTKTNVGIDLAAAEYACILHQDDLWLPGRVEAVRRWIGTHPDVVLHLAPTLMIDRFGRKSGVWKCPLPTDKIVEGELAFERLLVQNFVGLPTPIFRRRLWAECGGMDEALWYTADWDLWIKFASAGPVAYHDEITTAYRIHGSSLTNTGSRDAPEFRSQMQTVLERYLDRLPAHRRRVIEPVARASININVSLSAASAGSMKGLADAAGNLLALGPAGIAHYLRDSRLRERLMPRLRAKLTGAF